MNYQINRVILKLSKNIERVLRMIICTCENCGRTNLEIETLRMDGHVAEVCLMCAYVLAQNKERFLQLVRSKTASNSNEEMKQQHKLLSGLIAVGIVGIFAIIGIGIAENLNTFPGTTATIEQNTEYLSFAILKQFK